MINRAIGSLVGIALTAAAPTLTASLAPVLGQHELLGQALPIPLPGPLGELLSNPADWLIDTFNAVVGEIGSRTTADAVAFMNWLLSSGNVVSQTPPALTYDSPVVIDLWTLVRGFANAGLAAVTAWAGINAMIRPHIRAPYHTVLEALPRVVLAAVLVNTSLYWGHFVIDLNNALCGAIGVPQLPAWGAASGQPSGTNVLLNLVAIGIYLIMGLLLFSQMMMRLALVDVLLVVAPLAVLCWALPQTYGWARLWFNTFFATVFVQFLQVLVLHLGSELITHLPTVFGSGSDPLDAARLWMATLLLGMAVLQLARKIPRLIPSYASGAVLTHDSPMLLLRGIQQLMPSRGGSGGRR
jgi:hypothetical protein